MKTRKLAAVSAITIAALGLAAGTAYADPAPAPAAQESLNVQIAPSINYKAYNNGTAAVISTDAGTLAVADGQFQVKAADGRVVAGVPLELRLDDVSLPINAKIEGNTATLTPDVLKAQYKPVALPFQESAPWKTPYDREVSAWTRFTQTISTGAAIGVIVGAVGAAAIGCVAGGALGATGGFAFLVAGAVPGAAIGCLAGAATFAPIGTLIGSIAIAGPVAIGAAIQYFTTINEPFKAPAPAPK
ncbi:hypothetical protein [Aldersonia kunmingensis]|uniref:hypothetical protein n=1 Tax=Aldersonia kunmingensis TaxID=408066 RepID=UPI0008330BB8|nr:hypothetical protein [Aldersonia kunmingensis]